MSNEIRQDDTHEEERDYLAFMPGQRLQKAREVRGLTVEQVAAELRLSRHFVIAMESDDYTKLPEPAFVRGYMRRYAQLVKLSPDDIAGRFDECYAADATTPEPDARPRNPIQLLGDVARPRLRVRRLLRWASLGLIVALLAGFLFYGIGSRRTPAPVAAEPAATTGGDAPVAVAPVAAQAVTASVAVPVAVPVTVPATPAPAASVSLPPASVSVLPSPTGPAVLPPPVAAPAVAVAPVSTPVPVPAASATQKAADTLVIKLAADSWVSVRDAAGHELVSALRKSGESLRLDGQAPFAVNIGNAPAVTLTINGRPVDLKSHTQGVVATLTVNR